MIPIPRIDCIEIFSAFLALAAHQPINLLGLHYLPSHRHVLLHCNPVCTISVHRQVSKSLLISHLLSCVATSILDSILVMQIVVHLLEVPSIQHTDLTHLSISVSSNVSCVV